jgi:hypothetical protein
VRRKKSHNAKRPIVVDGVTYTWRYVNHWVEVRHDRAVVLRKPVTEVLSVTWDDLERGERKGYGFPLTPRRVAELIREARA